MSQKHANIQSVCCYDTVLGERLCFVLLHFLCIRTEKTGKTASIG